MPNVTGTDIWYYFICKRELWLMIRKIAPDQEDENVDIGRFLHEYYSKRGKKEVDIGSGKIDRIKKVGNQLVVQEIKKTSRYRESSYFQLLFYLYELKKMGIEAKGELLFAEEKKKEVVELTEKNEEQLEKVIKEIQKYARMPVPPSPKKIKFCPKCAYREYCWAGEE
ncbi:CRISPR-associated protein Cas4 [Siminovitchia sp. FSL H7-0308]|uniref:CRISPR-associated protein Cas4 n=1 Tax=Siminovitchia sp. FSL H7-0308 TaxID=2921432 RepID=UPI0030EB629A